MPAQVKQGEDIIEDGLQAGERVVVEGQYKLQQGSRVKLAGAGAAQSRSTEARRPKEARNPKAEARSNELTPK